MPKGAIINEFIRKYTLLVVVLAIIALLVQGDLLSSSALIIGGQALAILIAISARVAFRKQQLKLIADPGKGALIMRGPYRFIRHPMYAAALLFLWVSICGHWSIFNAAIGVVVTTFAIVRISVEERLLRIHYAEYGEYELRTKKILPFIY